MQKSGYGLTTDKKDPFSGSISENPMYNMQQQYMKELSDNYDEK